MYNFRFWGPEVMNRDASRQHTCTSWSTLALHEKYSVVKRCCPYPHVLSKNGGFYILTFYFQSVDIIVVAYTCIICHIGGGSPPKMNKSDKSVFHIHSTLLILLYVYVYILTEFLDIHSSLYCAKSNILKLTNTSEAQLFPWWCVV